MKKISVLSKLALLLCSFSLVSFMAYAIVDREGPGGNQLSQDWTSEANSHYNQCVSRCTEGGSLLLFCEDECLKLANQKESNIQVACYGSVMPVCESECLEEVGELQSVTYSCGLFGMWTCEKMVYTVQAKRLSNSLQDYSFCGVFHMCPTLNL